MGTLFTAVLLFYGIYLTAHPIGYLLIWIRNGFNIRRTVQEIRDFYEWSWESGEERRKQRDKERRKQMERWANR